MTDKKARIRTILRWLLLPLALLLLLALWFALSKTNLLPAFFRTPAFRPFQTPDTRDARWQRDLDYLAGQLTRLHPNPYNSMPADGFWDAVDRLEQQIPSLDEDAIVVEMMRLVALVGDGHTSLHFVDRFHYYPLRLLWLDDGYYVVGAEAGREELLGQRLVAIDGHEMAEVRQALTPLIGHENEPLLWVRLPTVLQAPEVLHAAGLAESADRVTYIFVGSTGERQAVTLEPVARDAPRQGVSTTTLISGGDHRLAQQNPEQDYGFEYLADEKAIYVQYNRCGNMPG